MNSRGHLSSETLDLLALASLPEAPGEQARAHLRGCDACRKRWDELGEDRERFTRYVMPRTLAAVEARARKSSLLAQLRQKWMMLFPALGLAAAVAVLLVMTPSTRDPAYLLKGGARLEVVARQGAQQVPVTEETVLTEGDRIRFLVEPAGARFLMVVSKDGADEVSVYFPYDGAQSAPATDGFAELPGSIELDAVRGRESLYAIFSERPVAAEAVRAALGQGKELSSLPGVVEVVERTFLKDGP